MPRERSPTLRVGGLIVSALLAFMAVVVLIGDQNNLFRPMNHYNVRFANVQGLQAGNPVQLSGVSVGRVLEITLPEDPQENELRVRIAVDRRYAERLRGDSEARIRTLGLLGDKFIALTSGTPDQPVIPHQGEIHAASSAGVDQLLKSGEGVMENAATISASLARLLQRLEKGDSVLGLLLAPLPEDRKKSVWETLFGLLDAMDRLSEAIEDGEGPLTRLLFDKQMGDQLASSVSRLEGLLTRVDEGDGLLPRLIDDETMADEVEKTLADMRATAAHLAALSKRLDREFSAEGEGLVPRLLYDEQLADELTGEMREIVERMDHITVELTEGDGTAALLLRDARLYEAINDIIVGIDESWMLRWLVRNRQRAGIEKRYREAETGTETATEGVSGQERAPEARVEPDGK